MKIDYINLCKNYFKVFSEKNIDELTKLFSKNVTLKDWENSASGLIEVLKVNKKIFKSVNTIEVKPINIYSDNNTVISEIEIFIDKSDKINVVDIISFDQEGKILSITAYKG